MHLLHRMLYLSLLQMRNFSITFLCKNCFPFPDFPFPNRNFTIQAGSNWLLCHDGSVLLIVNDCFNRGVTPPSTVVWR